MTDLYDATLDDYCRAALQSTGFHNFLKGRGGGTGPDHKVLKLRSSTCYGDSKRIAQAVSNLSSDARLNSRVSHLEGQSIFGSTKWKLDLPPGDDNDSHCHDRVNFTVPKLGRHMTPRSEPPAKDCARYLDGVASPCCFYIERAASI
jgi:hypothetical protein